MGKARSSQKKERRGSTGPASEGEREGQACPKRKGRARPDQKERKEKTRICAQGEEGKARSGPKGRRVRPDPRLKEG